MKIISNTRENDFGFNIASDIFTKESTSIMLIGKKNNSTPFHLDWARAKNWCISLEIKVSSNN